MNINIHLIIFFLKNLILHANSYKDPSHYKVLGHANLKCVSYLAI